MFTMDIREWEQAYREQARDAAARFFEELKNGKILGYKCKACGRVYVPPVPLCACGSRNFEEFYSEGEGVIETFTICFERVSGYPDPPFVLALIRLDNSEIAFPHVVTGVDLSDINKALSVLRVGARVRALLKSERKGSMLDFKGFKLV